MASRGQSSVAINFKSKKRAILTRNISSVSSKKVKIDSRNFHQRNLADLSSDELEIIARKLDTATCLNLLRACKLIHLKLNRSPGFWKHLCHNENFHEYTALK